MVKLAHLSLALHAAMSTHFVFDFEKTVQAAAVLLRNESTQQMNFMRLLKILYIAEREVLQETGRPLTRSNVVAMERGPVLEKVYQLIKGEHYESPTWAQYIARDNYNLVLVDDPGVGELSRCEIEKLLEVAERHEHDDEWTMVEKTHQLPEWQKNNPGKSCKPISLEDILEAIGCSAKLGEILGNAQAEQAAESFFARLASEPEVLAIEADGGEKPATPA